jgi:oligopeptide transport system permease protein
VLYGLPYVLLVVLLGVASDALVNEYISRQRERAAWVERELGHQSPLSSGAPEQAARAAVERAALEAVPPRVVSEGTRTALDLGTLLVAIGGVSWLTLARVIRGQVLSLKNRPFVEAARALGASRRRIFAKHLLPNLAGPIIVYATLTVPQAILQESFLSFLGIGVRPPLPSWGNLASEGLAEINPYRSNWWLLMFPCGLLAMTLVSLNLVGDALKAWIAPDGK